jgi:DNA invertase Pin-like site-specific DNA recombinase
VAEGKHIAYYRVSTARQGRSGLGLEAQRQAVADFLNGGSWEVVQHFTEVESGKKAARPQLEKALQACRLYGAKLVIARLDRLSRDAHFLLGLENAKVDFVAADMPNANRMTVGIMAMVAEDEGRRISARTKAALAAAKRRGTKLGGYRGAKITNTIRKAAKAAVKARTDARDADLKLIIEELQAGGTTSLRALALALTGRGVPTARGSSVWQATQVGRVLARLMS